MVVPVQSNDDCACCLEGNHWLWFVRMVVRIVCSRTARNAAQHHRRVGVLENELAEPAAWVDNMITHTQSTLLHSYLKIS